jgi:hypothetical protein
MNHTVIASHDITPFDIINTCFVCKLKQTCSCTKKILLVAEACSNSAQPQPAIEQESYRCERLNYGVGMAQSERQMGSKGRYSVSK